MKNKVLKQMLAFSLAVALVGGNSVATFAAEPTNRTESDANTQAATDATEANKVEKKKTASITFNIDPEMGKFTYPADAEYVAAKGDGYVTVKGDEYSEKQYDVPKVEGINGYTFTGWKLEGATDGNWDADAKTFGITGLAHYAKGSNDGYAALTAQFKKEAKKADAVLRVHYVDENGTPLDGSQYIVSLTKNGTVGEKATFAATSFKAPEGYELVGNVTDVEVAYGKDKDVNVKVKAIKEEKEAVVNANVVVDPEKGEFEGYDGATKLENNNLQEANYALGFLPTVTAKEGYTWTGWEVTNKAGEVVYTLDTNTSSIMFPYGVEDDYTVTATFTKDETPVDPVDPVDPTEPTQPTEPAQPTQPTQPATPSTDNTVNNATNNTTDNKKVEKTAAKKAETKNENKKAPKTGDESMPIAYMLTLVGAAVAAIIVLIKRKRTI